MKYWLMPHIQLVPLDDSLIFYRKNKKSFKLKVQGIKIGSMLVKGFCVEDLSVILNLTKEQAQNLILMLLGEELICKKYEAEPRFNRLVSYLDSFENGFLKLQKSRLLLLGVGGLGSHIFQHLCANGINTTILDHDLVSESNLSRQTLYGQKDVGQKKVRVCQDHARRLNTKINVIEKKIGSVDDLSSILEKNYFDLIISTIDDPVWLATTFVVKAAKKYQIPLLRANSRAIGPLFINGFACPLCSSSKKSENIDEASAIIERYQQGFLARRPAAISYELAFVGLICVREAIHFLIGERPESLGAELCWRKEDLSLKAIPVLNSGCAVCS